GKVTLHIEFRGHEAHASYGGKDMTIPYQRVETWDSVRNQRRERPLMKHPRHTRTIIVHELGHIIFGKNITRAWDQMIANLHVARDAYMISKNPDYPALWTELGRLRHEIAVLSRERGDLYEKKKDYEASAALTPKIREKEARTKEILANLPPNDLESFNFIEFRSRYDEFFADVAAIAYTGDRRSIFSALAHMTPGEKMRFTRARDFTTPIDLSTWDVTEVHGALGPARAALFQIPEAARLFKADPGLFVAKVFDAIERELVDVSTDYETFVSLTPAQMNERMISKLQTVFGTTP
ncbi:MAG: hypothetical protein ABL958_12665, partial [Bdellovibrionia bacterium]